MIERLYPALRPRHAHSVEVWRGGDLAGGVYGVAIGGLFSAESKFYRVRDASKVALVHLVAHLRDRHFALLDIQQLTPHTARLGATAIPRGEYLAAIGRRDRAAGHVLAKQQPHEVAGSPGGRAGD